ncbi:MAG: flagellar biosynthesis anti-sigma factor FlgM [Chloroflexi bacterium]|nr:flagellar biosynthesis anti-sigma factor FlgM [Chloroflexota bacterium]MDA1241231.1 flagellar biosynthesis anti-sigma factor FlgM [Chloroflexota bacterium]
MIQPIRPQDASGIYQRQVTQSQEAGEVAASRTTGTQRGSARRTDEVALSDEARGFARIMQAVSETTDLRADRVEALRQRVDAGDYQVDADALARLLLARGIQ